MTTWKQNTKLVCFAFGFYFLSQSIFATNGLKLNGYGARYTGMGGASTGVGGSIADLENNPAHLANLKRTTLDVNLSFLFPSATYESQFIDTDTTLSYTSKARDPADEPITLPMAGIMGPLGDKMGWGVALYAQGGIGGNFSGITRNTPTGSTVNSTLDTSFSTSGTNLPLIGNSKTIQESTFTELAYAKLTPALAIKLGKLNIGLGLDFGAATSEFRLTAQDTSGAADLSGAGIRYKSDVAYTFSGKIGLTFQATDVLKLGYSYRAKSRMNLDGTMSVNAGDPQYYHANGVSTYMEWPEMHSVGLSYKLGRLLLAFDVDYIKWASAFRTVDFYLDEAWIYNGLGFFTNELIFTVNWRDQAVYKLGLEYEMDFLILRAGYSYARSAVDEVGINPLFPAINRNHVSLGFGVKKNNWALDFALEYALPNTVSGSNTGDWTLLHTAFASTDIRAAQMSHSTKLNILTPSIGFKYMF